MSRRGIDRALLALGALVLASTALRFVLSRSVDAPWIAPDEHLYGLLGRSLGEGEGLAILGEQVPYYSLLYPLFVGVPFLVADAAAGVTAVQALQALVMSAAAIPVFLWTRPLAGARWAFVAAALTILMPGLAYSGLLMSEALYYPAAVVAAWALAECLHRPTLARQALLLGAVAVALATRLQAVGFGAAILLAVFLLAVAERSRSPFRRMLPTVGVLVVLGVVWIASRIALGGVGELVGAYAPLADAGAYSISDVARSIAWQAGALALLTVGIPLVALGILAWQMLRGREHDAGVRALVATAVAYLAVTVVEVGAFASRFVEHITERQLLSIAPPVFVAFAVWLGRGLPRPQPVAALVTLAVAASALLLPLERVATRSAAADALSTIPLEELRSHLSESAFEGLYAAVVAVVLLVAVLAPRRATPALAGVVALALAATSLVASREVGERSRTERASTFAGMPTSWIDVSGADDVTLLVTDDRFWPSTWHQLFWNASIAHLARFADAASPGVAPQTVVAVRDDGQLGTFPTGTLAATHVAAPSTLGLVGEPLATLPSSDQPGMTVWRVEPPLRLSQRTSGLRPNGDLHGDESAVVDVFACRKGELRLTLLGKEGLPTRIRRQGKVVVERVILPDTVWRVAIPTPPGADGSERCRYRLETDGLIGSTQIQYVPTG